jgi:hypothetical protein
LPIRPWSRGKIQAAVSENKLRYWNLPIKPWRGKIQAALVPEINAGTGTCKIQAALVPEINAGTATCRSNLGEEKSKLLFLFLTGLNLVPKMNTGTALCMTLHFNVRSLIFNVTMQLSNTKLKKVLHWLASISFSDSLPYI